MGIGNKGRLFPGKNGRRDWGEPEDEYDDDELDTAEDEDEDEEPKAGFLSGVGKFFTSRLGAESDENEDEEEEEEEDEEAEKGGRRSFAALFARKKAEKKEQKEDYDYDDEEVPEQDFNVDEIVKELEAESYAPEAEPAEESLPEDPVPEEYIPEEYASEEAPAYTEESYEDDPYLSNEGEVYEETEEEFDPFASLAYRAANPEAYTEEYDPADYAEAYEDGEYIENYEGYEDGWVPEGEEFTDDFDGEADTSADYDGEEGSRRISHKNDSFFSILEKVLYPALAGIAVCALCAIAFAVATLIGSPTGAKVSKETETPVVTEEPAGNTEVESNAVSDPNQNLTEAERQALGLATPEPNEALTNIKAKRDEDGRIVPDVGGAVVPKRSKNLSIDDFDGSAMIGNSFVEGMNLWSDIDTLKYICADGVSLDNMIGNYLYYVTVQNYNSIYLCLGLNEIGWSADTFITKYERVIDYIRSDGTLKTKNATIYIVSVMPVEKIMETVPGESGSTISKATIQEFNERLKTMCAEKGCWYLDVYSALATSDGYLPENVAADDHVHFEKTGYRVWTEYLLSHYVDEELLGD